MTLAMNINDMLNTLDVCYDVGTTTPVMNINDKMIAQNICKYMQKL